MAVMKCSKCHREIVDDDAAYGLDGSMYHNECPAVEIQYTGASGVSWVVVEPDESGILYPVLFDNDHLNLRKSTPKKWAPQKLPGRKW